MNKSLALPPPQEYLDIKVSKKAIKRTPSRRLVQSEC